MNDSTPLLGQVIGHIPPTESDMFLQVVESPWGFISGRSLFLIRISLATLMTSTLSLYLILEIARGNGEILPFRLMNLAWAEQCIYMWLTSYWTYLSAVSEQNCCYPYAALSHRHIAYSTNGSTLFTARSLFLGCLSRLSSLPTEHNLWLFSMFHTFYTVTMVAPFASTIWYFALLHSSGHPMMLIEVVLNTFNVGVALAELFFLNSVTVTLSTRDQKRMLAEAVHLALLTVGYCKIWVWIGNCIVNGPNEELDWRLFVEVWRAMHVIGEIYAGWWMLELVKGRILIWRKRGMLIITGNGDSEV